MTKKRKSQIVAELSRLSRDGWANARPEDYLPLERELAVPDFLKITTERRKEAWKEYRKTRG